MPWRWPSTGAKSSTPILFGSGLTPVSSGTYSRKSTMSSLHYASIAEVSALIRAKQISPVELLDSQLARVAALQPKLNTFVHLDPDAARAASISATEQLSRNTSLEIGRASCRESVMSYSG